MGTEPFSPIRHHGLDLFPAILLAAVRVPARGRYRWGARVGIPMRHSSESSLRAHRSSCRSTKTSRGIPTNPAASVPPNSGRGSSRTHPTSAHGPRRIDSSSSSVVGVARRPSRGVPMNMPARSLHYSPGSRFVTFKINSVKCALLICFDLRFPELYRELKKLKVDCIIQSFYNARQTKPSIHNVIMRQTMQCRAASNYFWVSMSNSSAYYSPYPSCFIQPDGRIIRQLKFHRPGLMINTVDLNRRFIDIMVPFRPLAMKGILSSSPKVNDPRSRKTNIL